MQNEPTPDWLNADFITSVLNKEVKGEKLTIKKFDIESAVPKGNNFSSSLLRVKVDFTYLDETKSEVDKTSHLIVKSLPSSEMSRMMLAQLGIFKRETKIYEVMLPKMYKLQQEKFGPEAPHFSTTCLYAEQDIIVMKDLCQMGYRMADRRKGLDMAHCRLTLKYLARFHGLSVALFHENPESMNGFEEGFYKDDRHPFLEVYFKAGLTCLASVVGKWAGYERFAEKILHVAENSVSRMIDIVKPLPDSISVLNHGDFWINNILFKYSEETNEVLDAMFVDFQISRFSSPCLDLQFFMCTSPNEDVRYNHMGELLEFYHQELRETLSVLGCGHVQFSLQQLEKEFDDKGIFGLITASLLLPLVLTDPNEAMDMDQLKEEDMTAAQGHILQKGFENPPFRDQYQKLLLYYEKKGAI